MEKTSGSNVGDSSVSFVDVDEPIRLVTDGDDEGREGVATKLSQVGRK